MNKKDLSERDICTKFINPAIQKAGWNMRTQVREEVSFTDGRIIVQGKLYTRGKNKRADYNYLKQIKGFYNLCLKHNGLEEKYNKV
ncbi:hypothetical protein [Polaribacter sp. NJDZ03]|uniref:hypothetical protein n=1 Tax=Polaribacter sp. NJDZ03 TaxID=2855841 RepID=UPI001C4A6505|nr:hypothetical protein [Polaribacter sp. NJDZ03]